MAKMIEYGGMRIKFNETDVIEEFVGNYSVTIKIPLFLQLLNYCKGSEDTSNLYETLNEMWEDRDDENPEDWTFSEGDAFIVLAAMLDESEIAQIHTVEIDGDSEFWVWHDLSHAREGDADYILAGVSFYAWLERDRLMKGADDAIKNGMSFEDVCKQLFAVKESFVSRFGEELFENEYLG